MGVIGASYLVDLLIAPPDWSAAAFHVVVPRLGDGEAVLLAVGIVGATVMRHAIYLHSGPTQDRVLPRSGRDRHRLPHLDTDPWFRRRGMSLIASGLSSSAVGTMAGQVIMQGFVGVRILLWLRRLVTMVPSFAVVAVGFDATQALILSQVALSLILPVPMIALLILTRRRDVMGSYANGRITMAAATAAAGVVLALNLLLVLQIAGVPLPGFAAAG